MQVTESLLIGEIEKRVTQRVRQDGEAGEFPRLYEEATRAMRVYVGTFGCGAQTRCCPVQYASDERRPNRAVFLFPFSPVSAAIRRDHLESRRHPM